MITDQETTLNVSSEEMVKSLFGMSINLQQNDISNIDFQLIVDCVNKLCQDNQRAAEYMITVLTDAIALLRQKQAESPELYEAFKKNIKFELLKNMQFISTFPTAVCQAVYNEIEKNIDPEVVAKMVNANRKSLEKIYQYDVVIYAFYVDSSGQAQAEKVKTFSNLLQKEDYQGIIDQFGPGVPQSVNTFAVLNKNDPNHKLYQAVKDLEEGQFASKAIEIKNNNITVYCFAKLVSKSQKNYTSRDKTMAAFQQCAESSYTDKLQKARASLEDFIRLKQAEKLGEQNSEGKKKEKVDASNKKKKKN